MVEGSHMQEEVQSTVAQNQNKPLAVKVIRWFIGGVVLLLVILGMYILNNFRLQGEDGLESEQLQDQAESNPVITPLPEPDEYIPPEELPVM